MICIQFAKRKKKYIGRNALNFKKWPCIADIYNRPPSLDELLSELINDWIRSKLCKKQKNQQKKCEFQEKRGAQFEN